MNKLNKIDFSDGIRPEEIQENFEMLEEQIKRERLGVGGYGIASGFDITPVVDNNKFAIKVSSASIIDKQGNELFIPACEIDIEPPELYSTLEHRTINYNNTISLKQVPYATSRRMPAEYLSNKDPRLSGIYINYPANNYNTDDYIRVSDIKGTVLTVTGAISKEVVVRYNYTADRIDTVYLKEDNTVAVIRGTTSTTPSKPYMPNDGKLLIAYLMIEHQYVDEDTHIPSANLYVKEDMRSLRNLFTDSENNLYICGTPFDDLQIIHMKEPKNPKPNTLWLNTTENTLYCWKNTDNFVYTNRIIIDTDFVENDNANRDFATYIDFLLDQNELEVYHNGNRLIQNIHYNELYNELPTYNQNIPADAEGNSFRLIEDSTSNNGLKIKVGDEIMYMIRFKDSHYTWVPVNKMTYLNAKNQRVYCTNDYMPENKDGYFDSNVARAMGEFMGNNDSLAYEYKYQYFFFDREKDLDMLFTPGRNELSIHINQMVLHSDQFKEITAYDLYTSMREFSEELDADWNEYINEGAYYDNRVIPKSVARAAAIYYGWTWGELDKMVDEYDNTGIGFMLMDPLDSGLNASGHGYEEFDGSNDLYVEAIVEKRICAAPYTRKFQRSATFVAENVIEVDEDIVATSIIELPDSTYYRYRENQLEVFLNGSKLNGPAVFNRTPDIIEEFGYYLQSDTEGVDDIIVPPIHDKEVIEYDQSFFERKRAAVCTSFKINRPLTIGDMITYKITTNIYSHDHVTNLLDDLENRINCDKDTILAAYDDIRTHKAEIEKRVLDVETRLDELNSGEDDKNNNYFDELGILSMSNMPPDLLQAMITSLDHIKAVIPYKDGPSIDVRKYDIRQGDYLTIVKRNNLGDRFLMQGIDYGIKDTETSTTLILTDFKEGDELLITGLKLGYGRR